MPWTSKLKLFFTIKYLYAPSCRGACQPCIYMTCHHVNACNLSFSPFSFFLPVPSRPVAVRSFHMFTKTKSEYRNPSITVSYCNYLMLQSVFFHCATLTTPNCMRKLQKLRCSSQATATSNETWTLLYTLTKSSIRRFVKLCEQSKRQG